MSSQPEACEYFSILPIKSFKNSKALKIFQLPSMLQNLFHQFFPHRNMSNKKRFPPFQGRKIALKLTTKSIRKYFDKFPSIFFFLFSRFYLSVLILWKSRFISNSRNSCNLWDKAIFHEHKTISFESHKESKKKKYLGIEDKREEFFFLSLDGYVIDRFIMTQEYAKEMWVRQVW